MTNINRQIISYFQNQTKSVDFIKKEKITLKNQVLLKKHENFWYLRLKTLVNLLIKKRAHLGQHKSYLNPKMESYIYGIKNNFCIINLQITIRQLQNALKLIYFLGTQPGSSFMLVGTQEGLEKPIENISNKYNFNFINREGGLSGLLTNTKSIKRAALLDKTLDGKYKKFEHFVKPDVLIVLNPQNHKDLINEANIKVIPVIGLVDTHCSLSGIDYPIIINNESLDTVYFILQLISLAFSHGRDFKDQVIFVKKTYN